MVGSNGIWPDGEPQSVRAAYDNQRQLNLAGRREIPMAPFEERFALMPPEKRARILRDMENDVVHMYGIVAIHEGSKALDRLCATYGIE